MKKLKITYVLGLNIRWIAHERLAICIDRSKFEVDFIILEPNDPLQFFLAEQGVPYQVIPMIDYAATSEVVKQIYDHFKANQTDVVHTIFFNGHITGIQAAYYADVPVRVFARQHGGIKDKRHDRSKYEMIWDMSTNAIAVTNKGVPGMIADGVPEEKISVIPNGFDISLFENVSKERVENLKTRYQIPTNKFPVIGVVARYIAWKGQQYTIAAFQEVLQTYPDAYLIVMGSQKHIVAKKEKEQAKAAKGTYGAAEYAQEIEEQLAKLPDNSYLEISFENDLPAYNKLFDVFVHVPINKEVEAFGQVYLDAMLSRVPSVFTRSGCVYDFAVHKEHAWIVDYENAAQITEGILQILADKALTNKMVDNAFNVAKTYTMERYIEALQDLYINTYQRITNEV